MTASDMILPIQDLAAAARTPIGRSMHRPSAQSSGSFLLSVPLVLSRRALLEKASYTLRLTAVGDSVGTTHTQPSDHIRRHACLDEVIHTSPSRFVSPPLCGLLCPRPGGASVRDECAAHFRVSAGVPSRGGGAADPLQPGRLQLDRRQRGPPTHVQVGTTTGNTLDEKEKEHGVQLLRDIY